MLSKKILPVILIGFGLMTSSCISDDTISCTPNYTGILDQTESLLVGTWVMTAATAQDEVDITDDDTDNPSTDLFSQFPECERSLSYSFTENRGFTLVKGSDALDCEGGYTVEGSWKYSGTVLEVVTNCVRGGMDITLTEENSSFVNQEIQQVVTANGLIVQTLVTYTFTRLGD